MKKIKLVIWDLDETFWKGTLSEGGVEIIPSNVETVKELTRRGIINGIVSKNTFDDAKQELEKAGVWEYFVFPEIAWEPKGALIKRVISNCQLRAPNVLFIDDNPMNLEEARYYNEGLHTCSPEILSELLGHPACEGKDDSSLSRLTQYKVLEKKAEEQVKFSDNTSFLKASGIKISFEPISPENKGRVSELIGRTNQLNYTKVRPIESEFEELIGTRDYEQKAIHVVDRYGDYGIAGYYCYDRAEHCLLHFVFSCRILNLGVEQFVYARLGFPSLSVVPDVAVDLSETDCPDWIDVTSDKRRSRQDKKRESDLKVFFKGGCDLSQMMFYLGRYNVDVFEETNYAAANNFPIHREHSQMLLDSMRLADNVKGELIKELPFIDDNTYQTELFEERYDVLVYSVLMDYTQEIYEHIHTGTKVPFGGYNNLTDDASRESMVERFAKRNIGGVDEAFLDHFQMNFVHTGQIEPDAFRQNLAALRKEIPLSVPIIFVNGAEAIDSPSAEEKAAPERHRLMNYALDEFIAQNENCYLLDVRHRVFLSDHITNNIRHYTREVYQQLSEDVIQVLRVVTGIPLRKRMLSMSQLREATYKAWADGVARAVARKIYRTIKKIAEK